MASAPADPPPSEGKKGMAALLPVVLAIVAGLAVGGAAGAFAVGPALASGIPAAGAAHPAPKKHARADAHEDEEAHDDAAADEEDEDASEDEEEEEKPKKEGDEKAAGAQVYTIDNLVLNPAGSGGTRFLLLTISFEVKDQKTLDDMKARDAELRDVVLVSLGAKSVEQLSDMTLRDSLRVELKAATGKLFKKKKAVKRVYFPQFVIQ